MFGYIHSNHRLISRGNNHSVRIHKSYCHNMRIKRLLVLLEMAIQVINDIASITTVRDTPKAVSYKTVRTEVNGTSSFPIHKRQGVYLL